ncbi:MAG: polysaccharide deacetylase family protein [Desulfobulbaceae bacterium]|nr:polysaccharide deacetylase family protein [Desulfobulbaceae bacterium]
MNPISLSQAVHHLKEKKPFPPKPVVVTFDDGYANNLFYGEKILRDFEIPVTVFLATNFIDSNTFFYFDILRCINDFINSKRITDINFINQFSKLPDYKTCSVYRFFKEIQPLWEQCQVMISDDHKRLLTPFSSVKIRDACSLFDWGAPHLQPCNPNEIIY